MLGKKTSCTICSSTNCFIKIGCSDEWVSKIGELKQTSTFRQNQIIVFEGANVLGMFFVQKGKVKVFTSGLNNRSQIVRLAKSGSIIGHRGYGSDKYPISAAALEESEICFIDNNTLKDAFLANAKFSYELMVYYSEELHVSETKIKSLAQMNVREKVADALLYLKRIFGVMQDSGITIDVELNRQDIADISGINTEQLSRILSEFKKENIIQIEKNIISIRQLYKLTELTQQFQ